MGNHDARRTPSPIKSDAQTQLDVDHQRTDQRFPVGFNESHRELDQTSSISESWPTISSGVQITGSPGAAKHGGGGEDFGNGN